MASLTAPKGVLPGRSLLARGRPVRRAAVRRRGSAPRTTAIRAARGGAASRPRSGPSQPKDDPFDGEVLDPELRASYNPKLDAEVHLGDAAASDSEDGDGWHEYYNDMPLDSETGDMKALTLEELAELGQQGVAMGLDKVNAYGVEAIMVAGFATHELPLLQGLMDARQREGSELIRLIPVSDANITRPVSDVLAQPAVPWNLMYGQAPLECRSWGKERVLLFSGLTLQSQAVLLEMVEGLGLGRVTPGQLDESDYGARVGDVLAAAVTEYRKAAQRKRAGFSLEEDFQRHQREEEAKCSKPVYDLKSDDPENLGNAINADGSLDPVFMEGVVERAKAKLLDKLRATGVDPATLDGASMHVGAPEVVAEDDEARLEEEEEEEEVAVAGEQGGVPAVEAAAAGAAPAVAGAEVEVPEGSEARRGGVDDERSDALMAVQEAFELAMKAGIPPEELEALIDSSCGDGSGAALASKGPGLGAAAAAAEMEALLEQLAAVEDEAAGEPEARGGDDDDVDVDDGNDDMTVITKAELRETAERHGLDYEELLRDAEAKGVRLRD